MLILYCKLKNKKKKKFFLKKPVRTGFKPVYKPVRKSNRFRAKTGLQTGLSNRSTIPSSNSRQNEVLNLIFEHGHRTHIRH